MTYDLVVVGCSLGGLKAILDIVCGIPRDFPLPIVIVQHRAPDSDDHGLRRLVSSRCNFAVEDVEDKQAISPGTIYFAPPDYHLLIEDGSFSLSTDERVHFSRPSIDVLFSSAADSLGDRVIGVLLTGANEDGARGLLEIKRAGGFTIAQDPEEAVASTMPRAAIRLDAADEVLPAADIPALLAKLAGVAP